MKKSFLTLSIVTALSSFPAAFSHADAPDRITSIAVPRYAFTCGFIYGLEFVLDNEFEKMISFDLVKLSSDPEKINEAIGYFRRTQNLLSEKLVAARKLADNLTGMASTGGAIRTALLHAALEVGSGNQSNYANPLEEALDMRNAFKNLHQSLQDGKTASCEDVIKP